MRAFHPAVLLASVVLALPGCHGTEGAAPPSAGDASPPAPVLHPDAAPADANAPMPPLAGFVTLHLQQEQGGPSLMRCKGVVYDIEIDLRTQRWKAGRCTAKEADAPLDSKQGTLDAAGRKAIDDAYAKLVSKTADVCGNDGGTVTMDLVRADGTKETWIDQNWRCVKPPPRVAVSLRLLAQAVVNQTTVRP